MNRTIIITVLAIVLFGAIGIAYFFLTPEKPQEQVTPSTTSPSYNSTVSVTSDGADVAAVQAAYRAELAKSSENNDIRLLRTAVVGEYALQEYAGDVVGGEALLKYDRQKKVWVIIDGGGGVWPLDTLVNLMRVPEETARAL